jgi:hypothetical protein
MKVLATVIENIISSIIILVDSYDFYLSDRVINSTFFFYSSTIIWYCNGSK